uniref:Uncharacterized protein n=1 Tax=Arion vulgaris TaxID=1028688 RepID=A0A0B7ALR5_9EUPU
MVLLLDVVQIIDDLLITVEEIKGIIESSKKFVTIRYEDTDRLKEADMQVLCNDTFIHSSAVPVGVGDHVGSPHRSVSGTIHKIFQMGIRSS